MRGLSGRKRRIGETMNLIDRICPICGKNFIPAPLHIYKVQEKETLVFCSYTCWNKYLDKHERKRYSKRLK